MDEQKHRAKIELQRSRLILAAVATNHQWQESDDHVNGLSGIYERLRELDMLGWDVQQEKERMILLREYVEAEQKEKPLMKTFKKLFRAIKRRLRSKGIFSPTVDLDLPKVLKGYDEKLGSCLELEYVFERTEHCAGEKPSDDKCIRLGRTHVRVCVSVNSIILLALDAVRKGGRQERSIDMIAYVSKDTSKS